MTQPATTITIMFTDLVGSAALGDSLGDVEAQALRRAHDRILRQQFERSGGRVIKGVGDGFMVAFDSARQGVECGVEVQRAIAAQQAEGRYAELQVRIGLHTGEPVSEGGDLLGSDVDLTARISAEADGGQVLVSELTHMLARQSPGLEFAALGERSLKGFAQPVALFEVRGPIEATLRPRLTRFTGREEETAALRAHLDEAVRGKGGLVLVAGEPGVGKTRLVSELAIYAADRGLEVLSGRAYETEGMPPYLPFMEPLGHYVRDRSPKELRKELDGNGPYLAKLLPELRRLLPELPEPPSLSPEGERYRLFESVCDFLLKVAKRRPLLLYLDDLHWADEASQLLLQHLAPHLAEGPLLVVGSYRDTEAEPLATLLAELRRQRIGTTVTLPPFGCGDASSLLEAILRKPATPQAVEAIFAASEGNPFFTEELVWHLREQGVDLSDPHHAVEGWEIPEGVKQVIAGRLARLTREANRLLAYSSVLGRGLSLKKVAAVTDRDDIDVLDLLEEAVASHVLHEAPEGYAFAHPLIRETLYHGLTASRRRQLHRRTAEALEALFGADLEPHQLVELAHHFFQAAARGEDVDKAIAYATRAAERALSQAAWEEAARLYGMALKALELRTKPDELERCELLLALGDAQVKSGDFPKAGEAFQLATEIARKFRLPGQLARAALGFGKVDVAGGGGLELAEILDEALEALGEEGSELRALVLARLCEALIFTKGAERMLPLSQEAVEIARRSADPAVLGAALYSRYWALGDPDNLEDRLAITAEIVRLGKDCGDKERVLLGHRLRIVALLELGDSPAIESELETYTHIAEALHQPPYLWHVPLFQRTRALLDGRLADAENLAQEVLRIGGGDPNALLQAEIQTLALRREQERLRELEPMLQAFVAQEPWWGARAWLAFLYGELGREDEARSEFERLAIGGFAVLPRDFQLIPEATLLSEICALLGDAARASDLYKLLRPYAKRNILRGEATAGGCVSRNLGLLATTLRRWEDAERHFDDALGMNQRMGAKVWVAWTQHDYAKMLLARHGPGDRKKAYALLKEALEAAREMGMKALEERAQALIEGGGSSPGTRTA